MSLSPETPIPKKTNNHSPRDKNSHSPHTHGSTHESGCTNEPPGSTDSASAANHQRKPSRSAVRRLYPSKTPVRIIQRHPMLQFPLEATNPEVSVTNPKLHSPATPSDDTMFPPAAYLQDPKPFHHCHERSQRLDSRVDLPTAEKPPCRYPRPDFISAAETPHSPLAQDPPGLESTSPSPSKPGVWRDSVKLSPSPKSRRQSQSYADMATLFTEKLHEQEVSTERLVAELMSCLGAVESLNRELEQRNEEAEADLSNLFERVRDCEVEHCRLREDNSLLHSHNEELSNRLGAGASDVLPQASMVELCVSLGVQQTRLDGLEAEMARMRSLESKLTRASTHCEEVSCAQQTPVKTPVRTSSCEASCAVPPAHRKVRRCGASQLCSPARTWRKMRKRRHHGQPTGQLKLDRDATPTAGGASSPSKSSSSIGSLVAFRYGLMGTPGTPRSSSATAQPVLWLSSMPKALQVLLLPSPEQGSPQRSTTTLQSFGHRSTTLSTAASTWCWLTGLLPLVSFKRLFPYLDTNFT